MSAEVPQPEQHNHKALAKVAAVAVVGSLLPSVAHEQHTEAMTVPVVEVHTDTITKELPADPRHFTVELPAKVHNKYQRGFETDADDAQASKEQVDEQLKKELGDTGWDKVTKVDVTGMASAEDENANGEQTSSVPNQHLADERAELAETAVEEDFAEHGVDIKDKTTTKGVEDEWKSDVEIKRADELVEQFHYKDRREMEDEYNLDHELSPYAVRIFLDQVLDKRRGAHIGITEKGDENDTKTVEEKVQKSEVKNVPVSKKVNKTKITSINNIGFIPDEEKAIIDNGPTNPQLRNKTKDRHRDKNGWKKIQGQKPVRHRGRTHQTGPHW